MTLYRPVRKDGGEIVGHKNNVNAYNWRGEQWGWWEPVDEPEELITALNERDTAESELEQAIERNEELLTLINGLRLSVADTEEALSDLRQIMGEGE